MRRRCGRGSDAFWRLHDFTHIWFAILETSKCPDLVIFLLSYIFSCFHSLPLPQPRLNVASCDHNLLAEHPTAETSHRNGAWLALHGTTTTTTTTSWAGSASRGFHSYFTAAPLISSSYFCRTGKTSFPWACARITTGSTRCFVALWPVSNPIRVSFLSLVTKRELDVRSF